MIVLFTAPIWLRNNGIDKASRHFCATPNEVTEQLHQYATTLPKKRWRKSLKVKARIWFYSWMTSLFPDSKSWAFLLPIKKEVRKELQIGEGDEVLVELEFI